MPYLRHKPTGDLYISTTLLLARTDMEEISNKQAAGIKSAHTREARLALANSKPAKVTVEPADEPKAEKKVDKKAAKKEAAESDKAE